MDGLQEPSAVGAKRPANALGVSGLVVSLVGCLTCGVLSPLGLLLSGAGLRREPRGLAIAGTIIGALGTGWLLFFGLAMILPVIGLDALMSPEFATHFGPQRLWPEVHRAKLDSYVIELSVVDGSKVKLEDSPNPTITCEGGEIVAAESPTFTPGRSYVFAKMQLTAETGWLIYDCAVRVREGPLKGAIIHVGVSEHMGRGNSIIAPYQAYYRVPRGMDVKEGRLDNEVVLFRGK